MSFLFCFKHVVTLMVMVIWAGIIFNDHYDLAVLGLGLLALPMVMVIMEWLLSTHTNCPLCLTSVMASRSCAKHRHARTVLGSHRLRVALAVLFRNSFCCPYCNESTELTVRPNAPTGKWR